MGLTGQLFRISLVKVRETVLQKLRGEGISQQGGFNQVRVFERNATQVFEVHNLRRLQSCLCITGQLCIDADTMMRGRVGVLHPSKWDTGG